jgi:hypothetical protein
MHSLEGTDSEYSKKAILAALDHLSRCLGLEAHRPGKEVIQGTGKKGCEVWLGHCYSLQALHGAKAAPCLEAVSYPSLFIIKGNCAHETSDTKYLDVGRHGDSLVEKTVARSRASIFLATNMPNI